MGERVPVVGVRVVNRNPKYPIRVNSVAFTPSSDAVATLWFSEGFDLPRTIAPLDADTIDVPIDRISETEDLLGVTFTRGSS